MQPQSAAVKQKQPIRKGRLLGWLVVITLFSLVFWQRQNLVDWWLLKDYDPPVAVAALATDTNMTDLGRKLFYINKPAIQDKATFYVSCAGSETTIVLGCYKPPNGIFLLKVDDARLAGVEEVTAAHEMLHAAYDRLNDNEKTRINNLVKDAYAALGNSPIADKLALYEQAGADTDNELHSIMGTEVANLPSELESHYSKYFTNRQSVVAFSDQYQAVFIARKQRVADLDQQLLTIEKQVEANNNTLKAQEQAINAEGARLDSLLRQERIEEYNQGVAAYNQSLVPFRNLLGQTRSLVEQYKTILAERNQVALEAQELGRALDSSIQTTVEDK